MAMRRPGAKRIASTIHAWWRRTRATMTARRDGSPAAQPAFQAAAHAIEIELIAGGGAERAGDEHAEIVQLPRRDQHRGRDEYDFAFDDRRQVDREVGEVAGRDHGAATTSRTTWATRPT